MARTVSVAQLGHGGASRAIRDAQEGPVLVSKENRPAAWIVSAEALAKVAAAHDKGKGDDLYQQALKLLAADLYEREILTLSQGAKLAGMALADFIDLCGQLQVPILWEPPNGIKADVDELEALLAAAQVNKDPSIGAS